LKTAAVCWLPAALVLCAAQVLAADPIPLAVTEGLLDASQPATLGLGWAPGAETFTVFRPQAGQPGFAHGVVLMPFKGQLYAQWQTSRRDEDGPDTHVVYSRSADGEAWTAPQVLAPTLDSGFRTSGGWWTDGDTLVAYLNEWPAANDRPKEGRTAFRSSQDGVNWSEIRPVTGAGGAPIAGIIEQDPRALPGGRILGAFHMQPGLQASPYFSDDPLGVSGWLSGRMERLPSDAPAMSRELEPSWYLRRDGAVVMVFRDQSDSFRKLAAVSRDLGASWTLPVVTNVPDSRSKQSAGNLPDGSAFLVGNPSGNRNRFPLAILLSADGRLFDRGHLLRSGGTGLQPLRFAGKYKRAGYSYPKSVLWRDFLYVGYATNKEDVELTRVPLDALVGR
jgi:hypothetical protein